MKNTLPKISKRYIETDRGLIHVQDCWANDNPNDASLKTLAFINITSFGSVLLDLVLPQLAALGYHTMALDMMGYGRSDKRHGGEWLIETWADNMEQVFDRCGVAPEALICGHFAALLGIELATRNRSGLKALMLDGTPMVAAETRQANLASGGLPPLIWDEAGTHAIQLWKSAYQLMKILDPSVALGVPNEKIREIYLQYLEVRAFEPSTALAAASFDVEAKLAQISIPTLVICGDNDWNLKHHDNVVAAIPNSQSLRFAGIHPLHDFSKPERAHEYVIQIQKFIAAAFRLC